MKHRVRRHSRPEFDQDEDFAIWRAVRPMSHIFLNAPETLYKNGKITLAQKEFIMKKGWSLQTFGVKTRNPDVSSIFAQASEHFKYQEFYLFGEVLAEIAWVLQSPETNTVK